MVATQRHVAHRHREGQEKKKKGTRRERRISWESPQLPWPASTWLNNAGGKLGSCGSCKPTSATVSTSRTCHETDKENSIIIYYCYLCWGAPRHTPLLWGMGGDAVWHHSWYLELMKLGYSHGEALDRILPLWSRLQYPLERCVPLG